MASLVERINSDLKAAMKAKDKPRTGALRMIRAAIIEAQKSGKGEVTDDKTVAILRRLYKQRVDAADQYTKGGREDLAEAELAEANIIDAYLPKLADEATTRVWVQEAIASSGATNPKMLGKAMGALMKAHKGEVDGGLARRLLAEALNESAGS